MFAIFSLYYLPFKKRASLEIARINVNKFWFLIGNAPAGPALLEEVHESAPNTDSSVIFSKEHWWKHLNPG